MKNLNALERMRALCDILNSNVSIYRVDDLVDKLRDENIVAGRKTVQNDIRKIREKDENVFLKNAGKGNIKYNFNYRFSWDLANVLSENERESLEIVRNLMEQYHEVEDFKDLLTVIDKVLEKVSYQPTKFVFPEDKPLKKGLKYFQELYTAIKNKNIITIEYNSNYQNDIKTYEIKPYFLKESSNMWYCIGEVISRKVLRTFSLDRITKIKISDRTFRTNLAYETNIAEYENVFGIVKPEGVTEPTTIKLAFERTLGEMFESRPFHPTQKVVDRSENEITMEYKIMYKPNSDPRIMRELYREICKYAGSVRIVEPVELKMEIERIKY